MTKLNRLTTNPIHQQNQDLTLPISMNKPSDRLKKFLNLLDHDIEIVRTVNPTPSLCKFNDKLTDDFKQLLTKKHSLNEWNNNLGIYHNQKGRNAQPIESLICLIPSQILPHLFDDRSLVPSSYLE